MPAEKIEFKVYGSMATKLAIDTSDMDISIHGVVDSQGVMDSQQLRMVTV
jgi:DNA polymerase sigma